jgi:CheY-like chemotaxis protein
MNIKAKILIVDDDPDLTEAMKVVLENSHYKVVIAKSGQEGLKKVRTDRPDLIILDVMMEVGDKGFDVARELKKNNDYKNIPILMLTAIKEKSGLDFKKEAGDEVWLPVDEYCDKPLKPEELVRKIEKLLNSK